jgi:ribosome-binding protein aMBF1 (putative translation factor)
MAGLDPAIHVLFLIHVARKAWMPATSAGMTGHRLAMTKFSTLHREFMKDPAYRREYDALEDEFSLMAEVAKARLRSGVSRGELARRMRTTQSALARLESGRGLPSTRTLARFAKATGHRLKISFEPVRKRG